MEKPIQSNVATGRDAIARIRTLLNAAMLVEDADVMVTLTEKALESVDFIANRFDNIERIITPNRQDRT